MRGVERGDVILRGIRMVATWGYVVGMGLVGYARVGCPRWRMGASHTAGVLRMVPVVGWVGGGSGVGRASWWWGRE